MRDTAPLTSPTFVNGDVSFWYREDGIPARRPALPGDMDVDVALVGGGYTSLWTAYYLKKAAPDLRIAILEKEFVGFGASGRNGGWLSAELPGQMRRFAKTHGQDLAVAMQREMFSSVDEVIRVATEESIDAAIEKDGVLHVATNPAQEQRLHGRLASLRADGWGEQDLVELNQQQLAERVNIAGARSAQWSPHCARIQPAHLVRGLAHVVEQMGVSVFEGTEVTAIRPHLAITAHGKVRATYVIRALEGFTAGLPGHRRTWLPMNSSMIVTEPLPAAAWEEIGWRGAEVIGDEANSYCYMQRTVDGRIAIGGRGIPYMFGSNIDQRGETRALTQVQLQHILRQLFPSAAGVAIDHTWSGVLGVPRDWCATVQLDQGSGLGWAGGYVGHGVTSTNLAGRTLRDLVLREQTDLTQLPWVGRTVRGWEPEPLRWLGVRSLYLAYRAADRHENAGAARTSILARAANVISGR
ncbi:NAD(P)/FAD-dependent oxidoreductase [Streptomyces vietnamensis]|uniref:NAD(P)/FAD-dependent oxidoreductase n=1 Tax=Streptomyces vietnamensis TaxID=362257 RepID=UPI00341273B9